MNVVYRHWCLTRQKGQEVPPSFGPTIWYKYIQLGSHAGGHDRSVHSEQLMSSPVPCGDVTPVRSALVVPTVWWRITTLCTQPTTVVASSHGMPRSWIYFWTPRRDRDFVKYQTTAQQCSYDFIWSGTLICLTRMESLGRCQRGGSMLKRSLYTKVHIKWRNKFPKNFGVVKACAYFVCKTEWIFLLSSFRNEETLLTARKSSRYKWHEHCLDVSYS